jgi:hypothetical protein
MNCVIKSKDPGRTPAFFMAQLLSTAAKFSSVYIMPDALDECTSETLKEIVDFILQFRDSGIKLFCTFRPVLSVNLGERLGISSIHAIGAHDEDIRDYLTIRLNKKWHHDKCFLGKIV